MATYKTALILSIGSIPILISIVWKAIEVGQSDRVECESGRFRLPGMAECQALLGCAEIGQQITMHQAVGRGAVKVVRRGVWQGRDIAVNTLADQKYQADFEHGVRMLQELQSTVRVTRLLGVCPPHTFVTQFHPLGSANNLEDILQTADYRTFNTLSARLSLCQDYVSILHSLHTTPQGPRVMCDTNDLNKTLSQFLLTHHLSLILNDVDALPLVNKARGQLIKCGHRELFGEFVAPEQRWPYDDRDFNDDEMPGYDEKVDIWKVPDVCEAFLGQAEVGAKLRLHLLTNHLKCKSFNPKERPSALELLQSYKSVREKLNI